MSLKHWLLAMAVTLGLSASAFARPITQNYERPTSTPAEAVSAIAVIADPHAFDGKRVRVSGFVSLEFENAAVYVGRSDDEDGVRMNSVRIEVPPDMTEMQRKALSQRGGEVEGVFRRQDPYGYNGALTDVTFVGARPTRAEFRDELFREWDDWAQPIIFWRYVCALMFAFGAALVAGWLAKRR